MIIEGWWTHAPIEITFCAPPTQNFDVRKYLSRHAEAWEPEGNAAAISCADARGLRVDRERDFDGGVRVEHLEPNGEQRRCNR
jgi:hypothetical protein